MNPGQLMNFQMQKHSPPIGKPDNLNNQAMGLNPQG